MDRAMPQASMDAVFPEKGHEVICKRLCLGRKHKG